MFLYCLQVPHRLTDDTARSTRQVDYCAHAGLLLTQRPLQHSVRDPDRRIDAGRQRHGERRARGEPD